VKERSVVQTPPLLVRKTHWRGPRILVLTLFVVTALWGSIAIAPPKASAAAASTTSSLNLRAGPGTKYAVILVMPAGASLKITGSYNKGFYPVRYQGTKGWASADYLTTGGGSSGDSGSGSVSGSATGSATVTTSLNLRAGPSTGDSVLAVMPSGSSVTLTGQASNGFVSVNYQGTDGWAYESYLGAGGGGSGSDSGSGSGDNIPGGGAVGSATTTSSLNLRANSSTSARVITVMPSGASVSILGDPENGFYPISYNGSNGWASGDYLSFGGGSSDGGGGGGGDIVSIIYAAADAYGQSRDDMLRVAQCESGLDPNQVTPPYEASGLFQFLPGTWASTPFAAQNIFDPVANANAAAWMWSVGRRNEWVCQ
jgi:uncharacterized protein YraI